MNNEAINVSIKRVVPIVEINETLKNLGFGFLKRIFLKKLVARASSLL